MIFGMHLLDSSWGLYPVFPLLCGKKKEMIINGRPEVKESSGNSYSHVNKSTPICKVNWSYKPHQLENSYHSATFCCDWIIVCLFLVYAHMCVFCVQCVCICGVCSMWVSVCARICVHGVCVVYVLCMWYLQCMSVCVHMCVHVHAHVCVCAQYGVCSVCVYECVCVCVKMHTCI